MEVEGRGRGARVLERVRLEKVGWANWLPAARSGFVLGSYGVRMGFVWGSYGVLKGAFTDTLLSGLATAEI